MSNNLVMKFCKRAQDFDSALLSSTANSNLCYLIIIEHVHLSQDLQRNVKQPSEHSIH